MPTHIPGVFRIDPETISRERGFFSQTWSRNEFAVHGLNPRIAECGTSFSARKGTLRGIHYQEAPGAQARLVRCTRGAIYGVVLDLRTESPTFGQHFGDILSADDRRMLYVPERCGHGFLTLEDATEVFYQMSEFHAPHAARGVRWDDPAFGIDWPGEVVCISERDRTFADFVWAPDAADVPSFGHFRPYSGCAPPPAGGLQTAMEVVPRTVTQRKRSSR
ncbi:MAG TPA: dTDP-4-dehydrorhamnose 3,5-epimerase family protein [Bryobacteraceae bacterium]|nr:dTDP-4-dehydrorhamnose 3,5-epimerase family protein [Bryobacteraceae bacterium]